MSPFAQNKAFNPYLPTDSNLFVTAPKPRFVDLISLFAVYFVNTSFLVSSVLVPSFGFLSGAVNYIILSVSNYSWSFVFEFLLPFLACLFAALVFLVRNPMHALLSLVGVFFSTVLFYVGAGIEFIGLVFLIVYVGAVAVLFLFVIMLLNVKSLTSSERLVRYTSQLVAIAGGVILFCQLKIRVISVASLALLQSLILSPNISGVTADAVLFYVRYRASDINALAPLYTQHSSLFMIITIILLAALLGAIIMATITTEKPTVVADICVAPDTTARTYPLERNLPQTATTAVLCLFVCTVTGDDLLSGALFILGGLFKDRKFIVVPRSPSKQRGPAPQTPKEPKRRTWAFPLTELNWLMGYLEGGKKKEPFLTHRLLTNGWRYYYTIRRIGLFRYIRFYYNTRSLPLLHYRATIVKLYAPRFFLRLVTILFVCVPFPWFLDDYDVAWHNLVNLYNTIWTTTANLVWWEPYALNIRIPDLLLHLFTVILLYPCAMVRVALVDFWPVMLITFFYVKDEYGHNHGRTSQACGRRMAYHMLRAPALKEVSVDVKVSLEARQRFLRQHPDKGRTDLLVLFSFIKDSWYQKSWSEREKVNIFREAGLADGYSVGAIRKILCYEYAFWPNNLSLLGLVLLTLAVLYTGSAVILLFTNRKLHRSRTVPTPYHRIVLILLAFIISLATFYFYFSVVAYDLILFMIEIHSPERVSRITGGWTTSKIVVLSPFALALLLVRRMLIFGASFQHTDDRNARIRARYISKRHLNDILWRSRQTYLDRYRGVGVDHSFYLDAEDEESEFNTPQNFENHEGPPELRLPKYKRDGMFYPRRRFNILRQDEAVFKVAFDKFMAKYGGL